MCPDHSPGEPPPAHVPVARPAGTTATAVPLARAATGAEAARPPETRWLRFLPLRPPATRGQALADAAVACLIALGLASLNEAIAVARQDIGNPHAPPPLYVDQIVIMGAILTALVAALQRNRGLPLSAAGLTVRSIPADLLVGIAGVVWLFMITIATTSAIGLFLPQFADDIRQNQRMLSEMMPTHHPLALTTLAATVAIYEELLFRGFLLPRLATLARSWTGGVILTALIFGLFHLYQGWLGFILTSLFGLVLALMLLWRRSILSPIIAHFGFDLVVMVLLPWIAPAPEVPVG